MKTIPLLVFLSFCFSLFTGCPSQGRYVPGPDGKMYYQSPKAIDVKDYCKTAARFSKLVAQSRSHSEFRDGKEFIEHHNPASSREIFVKDLEDFDRFTVEGKREYDKIRELLDRIIDSEEFKDVPPETVQLTIYSECMEKKANRTWFKNPLSQSQ